MTITVRSWALVAIMIVLGHAFPVRAAEPCCRIAGHVRPTRTHTVYIMLWRAANFLTTPTAVVRLSPDQPSDYSFTVTPGVWAVSAFEDVDENGKLDMSWFGPTEPFAFTRPFHAPRKPRFDEVSFHVDHDLADLDLAIG